MKDEHQDILKKLIIKKRINNLENKSTGVYIYRSHPELKKTFFASCIYRHTSMEISDLNKYFVSNLIEKLFLKNKK